MTGLWFGRFHGKNHWVPVLLHSGSVSQGILELFAVELVMEMQMFWLGLPEVLWSRKLHAENGKKEKPLTKKSGGGGGPSASYLKQKYICIGSAA